MIKNNYRNDKNIFMNLTKYSIVGVINAILTFALYFFCYKLLQINYLVSFSISWFIGVLFTYIINFLWVFKPEQKFVFKKRFLKYFSVYITSYSLNIFFLRLLRIETNIDPLILQLFLIPIVFGINFLGFKYWALKK